MKIIRADIYGFGKWIDQTITFHPHLNIVYGPNESGKSTLKEFILQVLFSFKSRRQIALRYEPHHSNKYGGRLLLESHQGQRIFIERTEKQGRGRLRLYDEEGESLESSRLNQEVDFIDRAWFDKLYTIDLSNLDQKTALRPSEMNQYYLNHGVLGSDSFSLYIENMNKQADALYTPAARVRPINVLLDEMEELEKNISEAEQENESYFTLLEEEKNNKEKRDRKKEELELLEAEAGRLNLMKEQWPLFQEFLDLQKQSSSIEKEILDPQALKRYQLLDERLKDLEKNQQEISQIYQEEEVLLSLQERQILDKLEGSLGKLELNLEKEEKSKKNRDEIWTDFMKACLKENLSAKDVLALSKEEEADLLDRHADLMSDWQSLKSQNDQLKQASQSHENEKSYASKELRRIEGHQEGHEQWTNLVFLSIVLVVSGLFFLMSLLTEAIQSHIILILSAVCFIISLFFTLKIIREKKEKGLELGRSLSHWQEEIDDKDDLIHQIQAEIKENDHKQKIIERQWENEVGSYHFQRKLSLLDCQKMKASLNHINYLKDQVKKTEVEYLEAKEKNQACFDQLKGLDHHFREGMTDVEKLECLKGLLLIKNELDQKTQKSDLHKLQLIKKEIDSIILEKENLHHALQVSSEEDFYERYRRQENRHELEQESQLLHRQLTFELDDYKKFKNQEDLQKELLSIENQRTKVQKDIHSLDKQLVETKAQIYELERSGYYEDLLQNFENKRSQLKDVVEEWLIYKARAKLMEESLLQLQFGYLPQVLHDASSYFSKLSHHNYESIIEEGENLFVIRSEGERYNLEELSTATKEQLFISLRLAFLDSLTDLQNLPIFIDDGFVNFDSSRRKEMYDLLKQLSENRQVFYFTMDSRVEDSFSQEEIIELRVEG